ncbi:FtsL-like putative cell division protein [Chitinophaga sp. Hz27]|uniref:FtsL-like putative cell division protein n=1 Tax=Chitinophaga sp. Hz27 TaxID=3347169 RepID=UPI0035D8A74E
MAEEEIIDKIQEEPITDENPISEPKKEWRLRINYTMLVQNMPRILFLAALALVYIANSHLAEKRIRRINQLSKEIKELKWEYINVKSELMFRSKMSEVSKSVEQLGLKQLSSPPRKIVLKNNNEK